MTPPAAAAAVTAVAAGATAEEWHRIRSAAEGRAHGETSVAANNRLARTLRLDGHSCMNLRVSGCARPQPWREGFFELSRSIAAVGGYDSLPQVISAANQRILRSVFSHKNTTSNSARSVRGARAGSVSDQRTITPMH